MYVLFIQEILISTLRHQFSSLEIRSIKGCFGPPSFLDLGPNVEGGLHWGPKLQNRVSIAQEQSYGPRRVYLDVGLRYEKMKWC